MMKLGAFSLQSKIGEGGMGEVWRGRHEAAGIDVAVKVMLPHVMEDPEYRQAFEMEVRSVAALDHPNIVTVLDFGQVQESEAHPGVLEAGSPYLVMEYARGGAVSDYFAKILWPDLRELLLVILDALAHAHAREVVHRDLKPENILVGCGEGWDVKLTDFGLAHASNTFTKSENVETAWGTPQYMAPEQLRGLWREYGPWTDLYALGCMAFELICGDWPFSGETVFEIGQAHIQEPIPELTPRFQVPEGVEAWVRKMMAKRRGDRFQHAADAAYHLAQLPALDNVQPFGVLFRPPEIFRTQPGAEAVDEGISTQLMPELREMDADTKTLAGDLPTTEELRRSASGRILAERETLEVDVPPLPRDWRGRGEGHLSNELMGISLGLFGLRSVPLVDREEERALMWELLRSVRETGEARYLLVQGAAGTGKSEVVRWLTRRAREVGGATVLSAFHSPIVGPADGLIPMMARHLKCVRMEPKTRLRHLEKVLAAKGLSGRFELRTLEALFESQDEGESRNGAGQYLSREERYAIMYRYLSLLAEKRPVVIWLDDVQWGHDAIGFVDYIQKKQNLKSAPIFVIMTARTEALDERVSARRALQEVMIHVDAVMCGVTPLKDEDTEKLVRQLLRLDEELAGHVLARSQGVPLFAVQLVEDWVARGKLRMGAQGFTLKPGADIAIPDGIHELWDARVSGFIEKKAPETLYYLELAAALGQEVDTEEWNRAQSCAGLPLIRGLAERLAEENLARLRDGSWQFGHGLMQESLERRAREAGRWEEWNRACAEAIGSLYGDEEVGVSERVAWHRVEAGQVTAAMEPLARAIDESIERSDYVHALDLIEWREELVADETSAWALRNGIDQARLAALTGEYQECVEIAETTAKRAFDAGEHRLGYQGLVWAGKGRRALGHLDRAEKHLTLATDAFTEAEKDRSWAARAILERGRVEEQRGSFEAAMAHFRRAHQMFSELQDSFGAAQSLNAIGDVTRQSGDFENAHRASVEAMALYKELGNISGIADCLNDLAEICRMQGGFEQAREFAEESVRLYSAVGSAKEYFVRLNLAMIQLEEGDYEGSSVLFEELLEVFRITGQAGLEAQAGAGLLAASAGLGRWKRWAELIADIYKTFEVTGVRTAMATRALSLAAELAKAAGETGFAVQAGQLVENQTESLRQAQPAGEEL